MKKNKKMMNVKKIMRMCEKCKQTNIVKIRLITLVI